MPGRKRTYYSIIYAIVDFVIAFLAWSVFFDYRKIILNETQTEIISLKSITTSAALGVFWLFIFFLSGFYNDVERRSRVKEFASIFLLSIIGSVIVFFALMLDDEGVHDYHLYYKTFVAYFLIQFSFAFISKMVVMTITKNQMKKGKIFYNTLIIGCNKNAEEIYKEISNNKTLLGYNTIAYLHPTEPINNPFNGKLKYMGSYDTLERVIRRCHIDNVLIAIEPSEHEKIRDVLMRLEAFENLQVCVLPDLYQMLLGSARINHVLGFPMILINQALMPNWQKFLKRVIDISASFFFILLFFPFLAVFALLTKFSSPGPIFFSQERIGKGGKPFRIYKFRSMIVNAETKGPALSKDNDPRITPWGLFMRKTRIDELPQFYNVLIGDMSLVGPRPERQFFIDQIVVQAPHYKHLHKVRPGITSLGQVKYGYAENVEQMVDRLKYDIMYIENMSIAMDLRVMIYTVLTVIQGRGK